jgi:ferredoxin-type protein NapG
MDCSRRDFFRIGAQETFTAVERAVSPLISHPPVEEPAEIPAFLRPPGALSEPEFLAACTRCDECIKACPRWAIRRAGSELGERNEGTPVILPETNPCWLCEDLPCIAACGPGALTPLADREDVAMGHAIVDSGLCYSAQGSICESCQERCPLRPRAITVRFGELPEVDRDRCTGCGICVYLCPADAIAIETDSVTER